MFVEVETKVNNKVLYFSRDQEWFSGDMQNCQLENNTGKRRDQCVVEDEKTFGPPCTVSLRIKQTKIMGRR